MLFVRILYSIKNILRTINIKGLIMNTLLTKIKYALATKPSNALLLLLTGFFFTQVMLLIILYTKNPFGGWETSIGTFTTHSILMTSLLVLSLCLITLWRSVVTITKPEVKLSIPDSMLASAL